jgi:hypothetical protein
MISSVVIWFDIGAFLEMTFPTAVGGDVMVYGLPA